MNRYQKEMAQQAKRNQAAQQDLKDYLAWKRGQHITWSQIY